MTVLHVTSEPIGDMRASWPLLEAEFSNYATLDTMTSVQMQFWLIKQDRAYRNFCQKSAFINMSIFFLW